MTTWQRFGDGTWVNVDHVEVVRVEGQDDGGWQLTATFTSGRTDALGSHDDRDLLIDCTDALLRGEVGQHLQALTGDTVGQMAQIPDLQPEPTSPRGWRFWRFGRRSPLHGADAPPDQVELQPIG